MTRFHIAYSLCHILGALSYILPFYTDCILQLNAWLLDHCIDFKMALRLQIEIIVVTAHAFRR
jgi:hypothetical protein